MAARLAAQLAIAPTESSLCSRLVGRTPEVVTRKREVRVTDWVRWHQVYNRPESSLARRLVIVQAFIARVLDHSPRGPIQVLSMCAGDARDLLGVIRSHPRGSDVTGRLVEFHPELARSARAAAPKGIEVRVAEPAWRKHTKGRRLPIWCWLVASSAT